MGVNLDWIGPLILLLQLAILIAGWWWSRRESDSPIEPRLD
ncbi:MAG: hypothetical protein RJA56_779, partial [Pseudomonadota bacterium]